MINVPRWRRIGLQNQPSQNQKNVPPSFGQKPAKKQIKVNGCSGKWDNIFEKGK
jgi:hypothetical protein